MNLQAQLRITDRLGMARSVPVDKAIFTIGRHAENDLQILGASVSRRHLEIHFQDDNFYVVDAGSKAGTFVNDDQVERQALQSGDRIRLGRHSEVEIEFVGENARPESAPRAGEPRAAESTSGSAREELERLTHFLEVNRALSFSLSLEEVLCLVVDSAIEASRADRGCILLKDECGALELRVARDRNRRTLSDKEIVPSRTAIDRALRDGRSVLVADSFEDSRFSSQESVLALDLRTLACIPLLKFRMQERMDTTGIYARETIGLLYLDRRGTSGVLSDTSVTVLESLAFEAAKAIESVRLMHEEKEKRRLESEFSMAREVQVALMPNSDLDVGYAEASAQSLPSRYVSGDFYDLFRVQEDSVLVLGDVTGKGIPAALLASMAQGILQAQLLSGHSPAEAFTLLNRLLVRNSTAGRFITMFSGILRPDGRFAFLNAGHNPPFLLRAEGVTENLTTESMLLGAFDFARYEVRETKLSPGDVLVAFTDGVTEAEDVSGDMYGEERLANLLCKMSGKEAHAITSGVLEEISRFTRGRPQGDDITVLTMKMK